MYFKGNDAEENSVMKVESTTIYMGTVWVEVRGGGGDNILDEEREWRRRRNMINSIQFSLNVTSLTNSTINLFRGICRGILLRAMIRVMIIGIVVV